MKAEEQYFWNEKNSREYVELIENAIPRNLHEGKFDLATANYGRLAETHTDLGVLHWRHGLDPRPDFERGVLAYAKMQTLAPEHAVPKNVQEMPYVYAMLALMDRRSPIAFEDENYHKEHRWPCYQCCLVHALHDQPLDAYHDQLLNT
jgi:hypothetical protein